MESTDDVKHYLSFINSNAKFQTSSSDAEKVVDRQIRCGIEKTVSLTALLKFLP